jgi:plasmid maintenance system antidote protein VapI
MNIQGNVKRTLAISLNRLAQQIDDKENITNDNPADRLEKLIDESQKLLS